MPFTFKKHQKVKSTDIKIKGKKVGYMYEERHLSKWIICFGIQKDPTKDDPAPFLWINLKFKPNDEKEGRVWLNDNFDKILSKFHNLYIFD